MSQRNNRLTWQVDMKFWKKWSAVAGALLVVTASQAFYYDTKILIDRAINSPTFTVRYSGTHAATVELRVNGVSIGTRSVNASQTSGETNFNIDLTSLSAADNEIEVRLFDKSGKLVGTEKTRILADTQDTSVVRLSSLKNGQTVMGTVDIKVGFGRELRNVYVSFFINKEFKGMTNYAPFAFSWDTTREANGWHDVEAWVVDDSSMTFKSQTYRLFVNNPGGETNRRLPGSTPVTSPPKVNTTGSVPIKVANTTNSVAAATTIATPPKASSLSAAITIVTAATVGQASSVKPAFTPNPATAGARAVTPGINKAPINTKIQTVPTGVNSVATAASVISIQKGQKLPNIGTFAIILNSRIVNFDVQPRVQDGVPLTPLRHLLEEAGGEVNWTNATKSLNAKTDGREVYIRIGDRLAKVNDMTIEMELAPFLEKGRTIVPLSFIRDVLNVDVDYDPKTGHVVITSVKK
ncbi:MAG: hypothetical protein KF784_15050 [Fimbriimonadaceae bacterium]|nr:hypothetical protein [Fimbriimonadaceae bacterium]